MKIYWRPTTSDCLYTIYEGRVYILQVQYGYLIIEDEWQWRITGWRPSELRANGFEFIGKL